MDDKRKEQRARTLLAAKILLPSKNSVIDCLVRNLSPSGARLHVDEIALVPMEFALVIQTTEGPRRERCRVVWRRPTDIGVVFN